MIYTVPQHGLFSTAVMIVKDDDMTDTVKKRIKVEYGLDQHEVFDADKAVPNSGSLRIMKGDTVVGEFAEGRWTGWYFI